MLYKLSMKWAYEKDIMFRTLGAGGISINNEFEKKVIRLRASKFDGTSIADSLTVSSKWSLLICKNQQDHKINKTQKQNYTNIWNLGKWGWEQTYNFYFT